MPQGLGPGLWQHSINTGGRGCSAPPCELQHQSCPAARPRTCPPTSLPRGMGTATPPQLEAAPRHTPCSLYLIVMLQRQIFHYLSLGRSCSAFPLLSFPLPGPATSPHPRAATGDHEGGRSTGSSHRARADPVPILRAQGTAQRLGSPPPACPGDRDTSTAPPAPHHAVAVHLPRARAKGQGPRSRPPSQGSFLQLTLFPCRNGSRSSARPSAPHSPILPPAGPCAGSQEPQRPPFTFCALPAGGCAALGERPLC